MYKISPAWSGPGSCTMAVSPSHYISVRHKLVNGYKYRTHGCTSRRPRSCMSVSAYTETAGLADSVTAVNSGPAATSGFSSFLQDLRMKAIVFQTWQVTRWLDMKVYGAHNIPPIGTGTPVLVVGNHPSGLDQAVLTVALREAGYQHVFVITGKDIEAYSWICQIYDLITVHEKRGFNQKSAEDIVQKVGPYLEQGENVALVVFPEVVVSGSETVGRFRMGVGYLASKLGCEILPAYISNTKASLPKGRYIPVQAPVSVTFGSTLPPPDDLATEADVARLDPEVRLLSARRNVLTKFDQELRQTLMNLRNELKSAVKAEEKAKRRSESKKVEPGDNGILAVGVDGAMTKKDWRVVAFTVFTWLLRPLDELRALVVLGILAVVQFIRKLFIGEDPPSPSVNIAT